MSGVIASAAPPASAAMPDTISEGVGVVVRVRPLSTKERADPSVHNCVQALPDILVIDANAHKRPSLVDGRPGAPTSASPNTTTTSAMPAAVVASQPVRSTTRPYQFSVDRVFHTHASQIEVYEESCKRIVEGVFHGINGSILAYGATGSGKTHTMFGSTMSAAGIVYQAVQDIFAEKERLEEEEGKRVRIKCSFLEVYNEDVYDLLVKADTTAASNSGGGGGGSEKASKRVPLQVRETGASDSTNSTNNTSGGGGLSIPGLTYIFPETLADFTRGVEHGHAQRFVAATGANAQSSRSHAIITVEVEVRDDRAAVAAALDACEEAETRVSSAEDKDVNKKKKKAATRGAGGRGSSPTRKSSRASKEKKVPCSTVTVATIQFGDLAGSERAAATSNTGLRLREGGSINRSLLALGAVVQGLAQQQVKRRQTNGKGGQNMFIPYRGSKLTRLLRDGIGGNCRTMMLFCVSPSTKHVEETVNTMKFAMNAREIQVQAHRNEFAVNSSQLAKTQESVIEELRAELARTRAALAHFTGEEGLGTEVQEVGDTPPRMKNDASSSFGRLPSSASVESPTVTHQTSSSGGGAANTFSRTATSPSSSAGAAGTTNAPVNASFPAPQPQQPSQTLLPVPPRPNSVTAAVQRGTLTPSTSGNGAAAGRPAISPLSASAVEVSVSSSMPRPSLSVRTARPSVFAENTRLFTDLEAKLKEFSAQKESLYHEVRDAEERQRDGEAQLRDQQWRLATFLVSDAFSSRARGEAITDGAASTVGVAGLRKTIASIEAAQVEQAAQLTTLTNKLEEADRQFAATRKALLRERQGTSLELLLDNARLRQGCTEAECLAAHYHQECRSLLNGEAEYAEALSKCVGALQRLRPMLVQMTQQQQQQRGRLGGVDTNNINNSSATAAAAALEVVDVALLFALLPTASTQQRMQSFESALRTATAITSARSALSQRSDGERTAGSEDGPASPSPLFAHPPLAPSPTNRSGSGSGSPTRSISTPQSNQLAEQFRDLVATAEAMHLTGGTAGSSEGNAAAAAAAFVRNDSGGRLRRGHASPAKTENATSPSRAFGRTVSMTGLTSTTAPVPSTSTPEDGARATTKKSGKSSGGEKSSGLRLPPSASSSLLPASPAKHGRSGNGGASAAAAAGGMQRGTKTKNSAGGASGPHPLQRSLSAPMPFNRSASARVLPGAAESNKNHFNNNNNNGSRTNASTTPTRTAGLGPVAKKTGTQAAQKVGGSYGSPSKPVSTPARTATGSNRHLVTPEKTPSRSTKPSHALSPKAMWSVEGTNGAFARSNTMRPVASPSGARTKPSAKGATAAVKAPTRNSAEDTPHSTGSGSAFSQHSSLHEASKSGKKSGAAGDGGGGAGARRAAPKSSSKKQASKGTLAAAGGKARHGSVVGQEGGVNGAPRRLVRSNTTAVPPTYSTPLDVDYYDRYTAPTHLNERWMNLEATGTTNRSSLLSSISSVGGENYRLRELHERANVRAGHHSALKEKDTMRGRGDQTSNYHNNNSSVAANAHAAQHNGNYTQLTMSRLLERSATVPALPQYANPARSPLYPDGGSPLHENKENQQAVPPYLRPRASLQDDLTVSRSTGFSDSPHNNRELFMSGSF